MTDKSIFSSAPIFSSLPTHPSVHASTIEAMPDGDLLVSFYAGTVEKSKDITIFLCRYNAKTKTWSPPAILVNDPDYPLGNPVLFLAPNKTLWLYYLIMRGQKWHTCTLHSIQSQDFGYSWEKGPDFPDSLGWTIRTNPITMDNNEILFPLCDESKRYSFFMTSKDDGQVWQTQGKITSEPFNLQPAVIQRSNHELLTLIRTGGTGGHCWKSTSNDYARSWSPAVPGPFKNPNSALAMIKLTSGNLVAVYNDSNRRIYRTPLVVSLSEDEGETWPYTRVLEDRKGKFTYSTDRTDNWSSIEFSYPAIVQSRDDLIHIVYTNDSRRNIKHTQLNEAWINT
jgi:predicted neuraminidase